MRAAGHREYPVDPAGAQQRLAAATVDAQTRDAAIAKLAHLSGHDRSAILEQLGRGAAASGW